MMRHQMAPGNFLPWRTRPQEQVCRKGQQVHFADPSVLVLLRKSVDEWILGFLLVVAFAPTFSSEAWMVCEFGFVKLIMYCECAFMGGLHKSQYSCYFVFPAITLDVIGMTTNDTAVAMPMPVKKVSSILLTKASPHYHSRKRDRIRRGKQSQRCKIECWEREVGVVFALTMFSQVDLHKQEDCRDDTGGRVVSHGLVCPQNLL